VGDDKYVSLFHRSPDLRLISKCTSSVFTCGTVTADWLRIILVITSRTTGEIRSEACNAILGTFTLLAVPAVGGSILRSLELGWRPITIFHVALAVVLGWAWARRRHLGLATRAGILVAAPFSVALAGLITQGRGNGVLMFFISAIVIAGCFFSLRTALSVVALCIVALSAVFLAHGLDIFSIPINPDIFEMSVISWVSLVAAFSAAGVAPLIGLSALVRSLEAERVRADEAAKIRSQILANMSHELRTPMAGIIGMADGLKGTHLTEQQQSMAANLALSGRNLLAVLNDVLDFARFENGHVEIEPRPFSISELVKNTCAVFSHRAGQRNLELRAEIPPHQHDNVLGDSFRIGQVLSNLVDNAVKFAHSGTIYVRVKQNTHDDGRVEFAFSVTDNGPGIPAGQIERIFDPFIQADMSSSRMHGGAGLGLAICRRLAAAMNGDVRVTSHEGAGTTFIFSVPLKPLTGRLPAAAVAYATSSVSAGETRRPLRLLVADDDENMRTLADIMFRRRGHDVDIVEDGARAMEAARATEYDCIVLDMHMPGITGPDVMRSIQRDEFEQRLTRRTPMIAITADVMPDHVRAFVDAGADAVVAKPVEWNVLEAKIQELTQDRAAFGKAS